MSYGFLRGVQYVILDRDQLYTGAFRRLLRDSGVRPPVLPAWSPNLNAFAERFVESAKSQRENQPAGFGEGQPLLFFPYDTDSDADQNVR